MKFALALSPKKTKFSPLFFSGDLRTGIQKAAEFGYDGVEISVKDPDELAGGEIKAMLDAHGLEVVTLATGQMYVEDGLGLCSGDMDELRKTVERLCRVADFAGYLGSGGITIGGVRGRRGDALNDPTMVQNTVEMVKEVCRHAQKKGVEVYIEPVNHFEVSCTHNAEQGLDFINRVGEDNIGLLLDAYHMNMEDRSIGASLTLARGKIKLVHASDNNRLVPGGGCFNFSDMLHTLKAGGYGGYISVEALPLPDSETAAKKAIQYLNAIIQG
jgi:sugar phosphate isomerase/epimerase